MIGVSSMSSSSQKWLVAVAAIVAATLGYAEPPKPQQYNYVCPAKLVLGEKRSRSGNRSGASKTCCMARWLRAIYSPSMSLPGALGITLFRKPKAQNNVGSRLPPTTLIRLLINWYRNYSRFSRLDSENLQVQNKTSKGC